MPMEEPHVSARVERLVDGLRVFGASYTEYTRRFADWLGLHPTDATALAEILSAEDQGRPLSPAGLAERVGLSSGATTNLVNRLERAGHVTRSREHDDRRVVTLRSSPDIAGPAREFFGPFGREMADLVATHPPEALDAVEAFLAELRRRMDALLDEPGGGARRRSEPRR